MISMPVRRFLTLLLLLLSCAGCSDKKFTTYRVDGIVKFDDGQPVKLGRIEFYQPEQDVSAYASIREDGTFSIGTEKEADGAVEGKHQVVVMQLVMSPSSGISPVSGEMHDHGTHVDPTYADFATSGLSFTVAPRNDNVAEFVVKKAKKRR